jgi:hypothetical protein
MNRLLSQRLSPEPVLTLIEQALRLISVKPPIESTRERV